jgi:HEPN domain-containing protein
MQDRAQPSDRLSRSFRLTEEEMANPYLVIRDTFSCAYILEIRKMLWAWLKSSLAENYSGSTRKKEQLNLIDVYERLEKLIEASYLIYEEKANGHAAEMGSSRKQYSEGRYENQASVASLQAIIQFIVSATDPEKIFLLNKNAVSAMEDPADPDLLIVIPDSSQKSFKEYTIIVEMASARNNRLSFSLHKSCDIQWLLTEGHIFYSGACTKNNLVYDNGITGLPVLAGPKAAILKERAEKDFWPGFNKAVAFLEGATQYYGRKETQMTAFMLHQAIELSFRAIVLTFSGQDYRTHCLRALKKQCNRYIPYLSALFPADTETEETLLPHLENAYIDTRYKDNYHISEYELSLLFEKAALLQASAKQFFEEKLAAF